MKRLLRAFAPFQKSVFQRTSAPDEIIAAAIVESFANNFEDWRGSLPDGLNTTNKICCNDNSDQIKGGVKQLNNDKKNICLSGAKWVKGKSRDGDGLNPWYFHLQGLDVNGISLSNEAADFICREYNRLKQVFQRTKEIADNAKAEMERSEAAWNLAERLLGKKRLSNGALVPAESFCESCVRHDGKPIETAHGVNYKCTGCQNQEVKGRKCMPSTGSNDSAKPTVAKSVRRTAKGIVPSAHPKNTTNTRSSIALIEQQDSTHLGGGSNDTSRLLQPLSIP